LSRDSPKGEAIIKAVLYEAFSAAPKIADVADPVVEAHGVVVRVMATGVCRSDWHGWMGHDPDIRLPHVPGHELAGIVEATGRNVTKWRRGDRVTVPFVSGCGACPQCSSGNQQICDAQFQPGFTHWGSFAEYVSIHYADTNLVRLPDAMDFATAASLGCRFVTSFRAVIDQGRVKPGEWVAVHGCGGIGLSAIMIASAIGANVVAVDIADDKLALAAALGASATINAGRDPSIVAAVAEITKGGAHVSIDALGHAQTCFNSINCLRKRGRHIQVGLMLAEHAEPRIPMAKVIAHELEIYGSHGMQAHRYDAMFAMLHSGKLAPHKLVGKTISLEQSIPVLMNMDRFENAGMTVVTEF
jgi:alcohol dehydrogenase